jgi:YbbR domain-containing protein
MKRFLREYLLKNWNLKVTAILLTLILWLFVRGEPGPERIVAVPLEVLLPRQMEITNERPLTIDVTMRGPAFSNIQPQPTCIVDLQEASEGEHRVNLTPENVSIPQGSRIEVLHLNPARIDIKLERTLSKKVGIVVPIQGEPAQGFEIYDKSSKPNSVMASGPRSRIEPLEEISTEAISIADQKQTASFYVRLNPGDSAIRTALTNPVEVNIRVGPRRSRHTVKQVPIVLEDEAFAVSPKDISVRVLAPPEAIEKLTAETFTVTIDPKELETSEFPAELKPIIRLPEAFKDTVVIQSSQPPEVTVRRLKEK